MIAGTIIAIALALGYTVAMAFLLAATFGLTATAPRFAVREARLTTGYKWVQALIWLVSTTAGGFITCVAGQGIHALVVETVLAASLVGILWYNPWESRQRGIGHQILMSLISVSGVVAGYSLAGHLLQN